MVARKSKNNLAATRTENESLKTYDSNGQSCFERLDMKALESLVALTNTRVGIIEQNHDDFVVSMQKWTRTLDSKTGGNESDDDEDELTIGQILSDLPSGIKMPEWLSKSNPALKNEKLNSKLKVKRPDDTPQHFQVIEESAKMFEIAQNQVVALQEKFQMRENTEDESLRKRREFALVEPEDLPFTKRMKEVLWADDSPNDAGPGDEDMVMEDVNIESIAAMKCPITQKPIERAAKANCPHYFDYAACMELFRKKTWLKCFTPGCPQERNGIRFKKSDVHIDEEMTRKIQAARKKT